MVEVISNDNDALEAQSLDPSASGLAAILLVESLIHGLIERGLVTVNDAIEIVSTAEDVARETADENVRPLPARTRAVEILTSISVSLQIDAT